MYTKTTMQHFLKPRNAGEIAGAPSGHGLNPDCGDTVVVTIAVTDGQVTEARFKSKGCAGAIASCSAMTELLTGRSLDEAGQLTAQEISDHLGGLPDAKMNCAEMAAQGARGAAEAARA